MGQVLEIGSVEELARWRALWDDLFRATPGASLFQHFDWLASYWRHFGQGQRLRVIVVPDGPARGIVPLVVTRDRTRVGPVRVLTFPLHDWGSFYAPIGPAPQAALTAALEHVRETECDWDMLDLRWIPDAQLEPLAQATRTAGYAIRPGVWAQTAMIDLAGSWDAYFAARSGKFRSHVRRCQRRTAELGNVVFERFRPPASADNDPRWDLYDACVSLAAHSWQGESSDGTTLSHASVSPFLREIHALAARTGTVDLNLLRIDGRPVAFAYNYAWDDYVVGVRAGYDPQWAATGVGHVLSAAMLRDSFARGDRLFDLGPMYLEAKQPWMTRLGSIHRLTHYPLTRPRVQVLRVKHWLCDTLAAVI